MVSIDEDVQNTSGALTVELEISGLGIGYSNTGPQLVLALVVGRVVNEADIWTISRHRWRLWGW